MIHSTALTFRKRFLPVDNGHEEHVHVAAHLLTFYARHTMYLYIGSARIHMTINVH
jgi:hypothetical protein